MIKECPVIMQNDAVTVIKFGDTYIQFPSVAKIAKTVKVKYDNGKYSIVDHAEETNIVIARNPLESDSKSEINEKKIVKKTIENIDDDIK